MDSIYLTIGKKDELTGRTLAVTAEDKANLGNMNVNQIICHCADQFRMMFGEINGLRIQNVDVVKLREMAQKRETVPTVEGLDQIAGEGTKPTEFEKDKEILVLYLHRFTETDDSYKFSFHPYFGEVNKAVWEKLVLHHSDHHLN